MYDSFSNLSYVLPPKVNTDDGISQVELAELCYQYKYDYRNRLIEKKIPGKGWEYIVYNKLDEAILSQDANQRANNEWLFTKYDALGREAYTGKITATGKTRADLQQEANDFTGDLWVSRDVAQMIGGVTMYYNNGGYPNIQNGEVLTINYYDDYNFDTAGLTTPASVYEQVIDSRTKSLATGSKVKVLGTSYWTTTVTYYDKKARPIYIASKNEYLNTTDIVESKLDFVGKVLETKTTHTKDSNAPIVTVDTFEYDHMGRLLNQKQTINRQDTEQIVANNYDELGQLISKKVGGAVTPSGVEGLQTVDYSYNIRGWLKGINDVANLGNDLFGFGINYNDPQNGATALFNGNISETLWRTANDDTQRHYTYDYDALNRITAATSNDGKYNLSGVTYDKMGNLLTLQRGGHLNEAATSFGVMDDLAYSYYNGGNKLRSVSESVVQPFGFTKNVTTGTDYTYDANGNMVTDNNKGISNISYNHLNLPTAVNVSTAEHNGNINYIYDATGAKLRKIATEGSSVTTTDYAGNYIYKNGILEFFNHPEGYIEPEQDGTYTYIYQFKDHLGNIRLSYSDRDNDGVVDVLRNTTDVDGDNDYAHEILEENNYYPFGGLHKGYNISISSTNAGQDFKYNGKEFNQELGLDWYDYGARNYDAYLGRWMNLDPLAEKYVEYSSYAYVVNNPILFVDPDGKQIDVSEIYQKDKDGNDVLDENGNKIITGYNISVTGKLINFSDNKVDLTKAVADITSYIEETFKGVFDGKSVSTTVNLTVADNMEEVDEKDHLFVLAESGDGSQGIASGFGERVAFIDADYFTGWWDTNYGTTGQEVATHELGHLFNLRHYDEGLMEDSDGLLPNSRGNEVFSWQLQNIVTDAQGGLLNQGRNYNEKGLPQENRKAKGAFILKNTKGRNKKVNN